MTASDDYPILVDWLGGREMTGLNGDLMEIAVVQALDEIDNLRAAVDLAIRAYARPSATEKEEAS